MAPKTRFTIRHQYDDEHDAALRDATDIVNNEPSLTKQEFTDNADINIVMKRFGIDDGALLPQAADPRYYGDFTDATDLRESLDRTTNALERFNQLPAEIRRRFDHSPVELHRFIMDPANAEEAITLGLLHRDAAPPKPEPMQVVVVKDTTSESGK